MNLTIADYKQKLKGLPKEEKINIINQDLTNRAFSGMSPPLAGIPLDQLSKFKEYKPESDTIGKNSNQDNIKPVKLESPTDEQLNTLLSEIDNNIEAYESETKRKELVPYIFDRDLNWYFNAKNIPAQQNLVIPTYDFFNEGAGKGAFEPLDFFNLLEKQQKELLSNLEKPFDVLKNLKSIPLTERERHILYGFILKWFGGYPINNSNEQMNTVLRLIEKEFLKFPEHTPEKEFCSKALNNPRKFKELAAHLSAEMPGVRVIAPDEPEPQSQHKFPESHYVQKVPFDFEDLPHYVIQRAIIWKFENLKMYKDEKYSEWQDRLIEVLNSVPNEYRLKALSKGIEYGKKVLKYHLDNECTNPLNCDLNQSWERRIALAENIIKRMSVETQIKQEPGLETNNERNKDFTTARQVLAIHYLLEYSQVKNIDATEKARFIQFLTGKETGAKNIQNTNIYKKIKSPLSPNEKTLIEDLQFIRPYFEKLGLTGISKSISNEISSRE